MPNVTGPALSFPAASFPGSAAGAPTGAMGEFLMSPLMGRYATLVKEGKVFASYATLTAPVIFTTAAGTGGPLLWNPSASGVDAYVLAVGFSSSVVTTVAGGIGLTGNGGQAVAPTSTTAIDATGNMLVGGGASACTTYRVGTPANAGNRFFPLAQFHTGALTVDNTAITWIDLGGVFVVPASSWGSIAATATLTTLQVAVGMVWAELPA